jgi:hypothetical protein
MAKIAPFHLYFERMAIHHLARITILTHLYCCSEPPEPGFFGYLGFNFQRSAFDEPAFRFGPLSRVPVFFVRRQMSFGYCPCYWDAPQRTREKSGRVHSTKVAHLNRSLPIAADYDYAGAGHLMSRRASKHSRSACVRVEGLGEPRPREVRREAPSRRLKRNIHIEHIKLKSCTRNPRADNVVLKRRCSQSG